MMSDGRPPDGPPPATGHGALAAGRGALDRDAWDDARRHFERALAALDRRAEAEREAAAARAAGDRLL